MRVSIVSRRPETKNSTDPNRFFVSSFKWMPYHPMGIYRTVPWMLYCYTGNESKAHFWIRMDGFPPLGRPPSPGPTADSLGAPAPRNKKNGAPRPGEFHPLRRAPWCGTTKKKHGWKASNLWSPMVRSSSTNCLPARIRTWWSGGYFKTEWRRLEATNFLSGEVEKTQRCCRDVFVVYLIWKLYTRKLSFLGQKNDVCPVLALFEHGALTTYFF